MLLLFSVPLMIALPMLSASVLAHILQTWWLFLIAGAIVPIVGMGRLGTLLAVSTVALSAPAGSRLGAVLRFWLGGTLLCTLTLMIMGAVGDTTNPGWNPTLGLLIVAFDYSMLVSFGIWAVTVPMLLSSENAIGGALITGFILFAIVGGGGYLMFHSTACPLCDNPNNPYLHSNESLDDALACQNRGGKYDEYDPTNHPGYFSCR